MDHSTPVEPVFHGGRNMRALRKWIHYLEPGFEFTTHTAWKGTGIDPGTALGVLKRLAKEDGTILVSQDVRVPYSHYRFRRLAEVG